MSIRSGMKLQKTFEFKISLKDKPAGKSDMLSKLSPVYDPLCLASPFILKGRRIIQKLRQGNTSWDSTVSDETQKEWTKWKSKLPALEEEKFKDAFSLQILRE